MILLDTNLLGRMTDSGDPLCMVGITRLLTFDADDFKGFAITLIDPASLE